MGSLKLWYFETKKPRNFQTNKPRNFETEKPIIFDTKEPKTKKPINQETFLFSSGNPQQSWEYIIKSARSFQKRITFNDFESCLRVSGPGLVPSATCSGPFAALAMGWERPAAVNVQSISEYALSTGQQRPTYGPR